MTDTAIAETFFRDSDLTTDSARRILGEALAGADDGELFLQSSESEVLVFDNGRLAQSSFDTSSGFGMRAVAGESAGHAHGSELTGDALRRAADSVSAVRAGHSGTVADAPPRTNRRLYEDADPINDPAFADRVALVEAIDAHARRADPRVSQVTVSLAAARSTVGILRGDGSWSEDVRPLMRLNVSVVVADKGRRESGSAGQGGR
ncbi:MAG: PmbA/TldA family metallopeptidase, partial [Flavobacteriaceae bacterium]